MVIRVINKWVMFNIICGLLFLALIRMSNTLVCSSRRSVESVSTPC